MTGSHSSENIAAENESSLKTLARAIRLSQGQFRLILVRCNYWELRDRMVQRLQELSPVEIRDIVLPKSVKSLYTTIKAELGDEVPNALMVFGLELVSDLSKVLKSSNYIREEFSHHFPFPLLLWINDDVLKKLLRSAPDLESWATSVEFKLSSQELLDFLRRKTEQFFGSDARVNRADCGEIEAACHELRSRGEELEPELEASLEFVRGLDNYTCDQIDEALEHFQRSLAFWQQGDDLERRGVVLLNIAFCFYRKATNNSSESHHFLVRSRDYFKQCINVFAQAKRIDLVVNYISRLGKILQKLQAWDDLEILVKKAWTLHQKYGEPRQIAQDYGFWAEISLARSNWEKAYQFAQQAIQVLEQIPNTQPQEFSLHRFILARSCRHLGQVPEALSHLEQARRESHPQDDPQLYIDILEELRSLYFQESQYLDAFEIKQEKRSLEYQYGFQAFTGASQLQPKLQLISPTLQQTSQQAIISQEIAASGREEFVKGLVKRISSSHHKLTVIHGQSGVGKSSIIQAGLVPALKQQPIGERDVLPLVLKVYTDWIGMLGRCLTENFEEVRAKTLPTAIDSTKAIIEQLQFNADYNLLTVLIFDQFEEFFFACKEPAKRQQFYEFLGTCLNIPFIKVILSLREDYLHYLLECNRLNQLDAINNNILDKDILCYLGDFSQDEATLVIESLTKRSKLYLEPVLIDELVKDLAGEFDLVRPIELQIVGAQLQENSITTLEKYRQLGENPKAALVKQYLEGVIKDCGKEYERIARLVLYWLTDENLTRPFKTRTELTKDLAGAGLKVEANPLDFVLQILVGSGLVVRVPESPDDRYQLVHDYLVVFIRQQQGVEVEALRKEVEFQRKRAEELQIIGQSDALIRYSEALFNQGKKLEALVEGIRAGILMRQAGEAKGDTWMRIVTTLRREVYGVLERNYLEGHNDVVNGISFSPNGKMIASASSDGTIKLWGCDGKLLHTFKGHYAVVYSVSFSPDSKTIASASEDKTIKIWSCEGKLLHTIEGHNYGVYSVCFSPDGKTIASAGWDRTIKLWSCEGNLLHTLKGQGHYAGVHSISFSPDGKTIASASWDKSIKFWSCEGNLLHTLKGHQDVVYGISFSPDGKTIASASEDKTIKLWSSKGNLLYTIDGHQEAVHSVCYSPDSRTIASASSDGTIKFWSLEGNLLHTLKGHQDAVYGISYSPDGETIASASRDKTIKLWSVKGNFPHILKGHDAAVNSISFSFDSQMLASASEDKTIKLWSCEGNLLHTFYGHDDTVNNVSFSPDGKTIASASWDKTIKFWSCEGNLLHTLYGHDGAIYSLSFNSDGEIIASASRDKTIKLWSREGNLLQTLKGHEARVNSVSFSPDDKMIASASWDKTIKIWNREGNLLQTLKGHNNAIYSVSFSPDGKMIASASRDKTIKLWSLEGNLLHTIEGHYGGVNSINFSPDGKTVISASWDKTIKLWSLEGNLLHTLDGQEDIVNSVSFSPNGKMIASASWDGTVILWNLDLDDLLLRGCNWVRDYLKTNPNVRESDRILCDGICLE